MGVRNLAPKGDVLLRCKDCISSNLFEWGGKSEMNEKLNLIGRGDKVRTHLPSCIIYLSFYVDPGGLLSHIHYLE